MFICMAVAVTLSWPMEDRASSASLPNSGKTDSVTPNGMLTSESFHPKRSAASRMASSPSSIAASAKGVLHELAKIQLNSASDCSRQAPVARFSNVLVDWGSWISLGLSNSVSTS